MIDLLLRSRALYQTWTSAEIGIKFLFDHTSMSCNFSKRTSDDKGPNWTLNRSLINDELYKPLIIKEIKQFFEFNANCGVSTPVVWDAFKAVLRGQLISLASACKKEREKITNDLKTTIAQLELRHLRYGGRKNLHRLNLARKKLELHETSKKLPST